MESNYSLADIAAATGDKEGGMDNNWFWIVVLFLFAGRGFGGMGGGAGEALTRADLCQGFNFNNLEQGVRGVQNGLCDGFYAQNTTMLQGFNGLQRDLCSGFGNTNQNIAGIGYKIDQCCCETNRNIDSVRFQNEKNTCEITTAIHAEGEATRALITQNEIQKLRDELQSAQLALSNAAQTSTLVSELRPCAKPAYITCSPYTSNYRDRGGCGCGDFA